MTDGSGSSTEQTALALFLWSLTSPVWIFESEDTYNDEIRDSVIPMTVTVLGAVLCIPSGGASVIFGLSWVQIAGIGTAAVGVGLIVVSVVSIDTSWKSMTFYNINNPNIKIIFWVEYYIKDGIPIYYSASTYRPIGLVQD